MNIVILYWILSSLAVLTGAYVTYRGFTVNRRDSATFSVLVIMVIFQVIISSLTVLSANVAEVEFWFQLRFSIFILLPIAWMQFAAIYSRRTHRVPKWFQVIVAIFASTLLLALWTDPIHNLFYSDFEGVWQDGIVTGLEWQPEIIYWVFLGYAYSMVILGVAFLYRISWGSHPAYRGQKLIVMAFGGLYLMMSILTRLEILPGVPDWSTLSLLAFSSIGFFAVSKFRAIRVVPVAHDLLFREMPDAIIILDRYGNLMDANKKAQIWFSINLTQRLGRALEGRLHRYTTSILENLDQEPINWRCQIPEAPQWLSVRLMPLSQDEKSEEGSIIAFRDITNQQKLYEEVRELASKDPLTGLFNRRYFFERANPLWALALRHERPLGLLVMDLDHFKDINDNSGHAAGDYVLVETAKLISGCLRESDVLSRFGGEEFLALLPETEEQKASLVAEKIRAAIEAHEFRFEGKIFMVSISVGVCSFPKTKAENLDQLIAGADKALYEAKHSGRNAVSSFRSHQLTPDY